VVEISERSFEQAIECGLLVRGPDACAGDPKAVKETAPPYGESVPAATAGAHRSNTTGRLSGEIGKRGLLDVLRRGIKESGAKFKLAFFPPASGLNEELRRLYEAISSPSSDSSTTAPRASRTRTWGSS